MEKKSQNWLLGFIALGIIWGSSFLFIKWGLESLTAVGVAFWRCAIGSMALLLISAVSRSALPTNPKHWFHISVVAFLLNAFPAYLFGYGETHVTSVMAGMLNATTPLMTVLVISMAFREEAINRNQTLGLFIGIVGILLVTGAFENLSHNDFKGIFALLLATFCYGVSFPYSKKHVSQLSYSSTTLATTQVTAAAVMLLPFAIIQGDKHAPWSQTSFWAILTLGALGTGVAYILNFRNVRLAGSTIASTVTYITPVVATILGILFLNEPFKISQIVGGALVLLSAALVQKRIRLLKN